MTSFSFLIPADFDNYAREVEAKGWFAEAKIIFSERSYRLNFYDPVRLSQEIESELQSGNIFFEPNLVVIQSVTRFYMEQAVEMLMRLSEGALLTPEKA